jgi:hypothetical protein
MASVVTAPPARVVCTSTVVPLTCVPLVESVSIVLEEGEGTPGFGSACV